MVDNQHRKIAGYRDLTESEIASINALKDAERKVTAILDEAAAVPGANQRSLALGRTNIQTGFMWAIRGIARPNGE